LIGSLISKLNARCASITTSPRPSPGPRNASPNDCWLTLGMLINIPTGRAPRALAAHDGRCTHIKPLG
jgi:hypothetical protein